MVLTRAMASLATPKVIGGAYYAGKAIQAASALGRTISAANRQRRYNRAIANIRRVRNKGFGGSSSAVYVGRFNRPKKNKTTKVEQYLSQGVMNYKEVYGDVNDPDVVYMGYSTYDEDLIFRTITQGLLKKLFKKAGIDIDSVNREIPITAYNDSSGAILKAIYKDAAGNIVTSNHTILNNESLNTLYNKVGLVDFYFTMVRAPQGIFTSSDYQLERIGLYTSGDRVMAELNVMREVMQIEMFLTISIQNRTKGASAGTGDADLERVDSQPLQGTVYEFSGGVPKSRVMGYNENPMNHLSLNDGIALNRGAQFEDGYREPPPARAFSNCTKHAKSILQPGTIKRHYLKWYARGYFNNLMGKWRASPNLTSAPLIAYCPGKSVVFCFEEVLNSGSANKITCSYEVDKKCGVKFITAKPTPMVPHRIETSHSNTT